MSSEPALFCAERDELRKWLAELGRAAADFADFAAAELDEMAATAARLDRREHDLAERCEEVERQVVALSAARQRLDDSSTAAEQCADELRAMAARFTVETGRDISEQIAAVTTERQRLSAEFETARAATDAVVHAAAGDMASAQQAVANARAELTTAREELSTERQRLTEALAPVQETIAAQLADFAAQRAELAAQLESAATMFAAQAAAAMQRQAVAPHSAAEEKFIEQTAADETCDAGAADAGISTRETISESPERATWWNELKQLRTRLGHNTPGADQRRSRDAGLPAHAPHVGRHSYVVHRPALDTEPSAQLVESSADPELDSVIAQFEMLQHELAGERRTIRRKQD